MNINNWDKIKARHTALWQNEIIDRCCIAVTVPGGWLPYPEDPEKAKRWWTDPETIFWREEHRIKNTYHAGDAFPLIKMAFGVNSMATRFGAKPIYTENTVWFEPAIHDWDEDKLEVIPDEAHYENMFTAAKYLTERAGDEYFVSMPDNGSALDALAQIRGTDNLLMDFLTEPERVKHATRLITETWLESNERIFDIYKNKNSGGNCIHWLETWAPGRHAQLQCDLSVMISNEQFEEFAMEELVKAARSMDNALYHFDGVEQIRHLDSLLSIKEIKMIQWTSVAGQPPATDYLDTLRRIQAAGKGLLLLIPAQYVEEALRSLSSKGLYIVTEAGTPEEADALVRLAEKLTHE